MQITVPFESYKYLRCLSIFAGLIGAAQAIAWLGMSVVALLAYNCHISFVGMDANFGTVLRYTIFEMYFRGECTPDGWQQVDFTAIANLDLMTPSVVYIWMWVVASFSFVWLFVSITLITSIKKSNMKYVNIFLFLWIFITAAVCAIDVVLAVYFFMDYYTIVLHSFDFELNFVPSTLSILLAAQNTSGMMASLALRGYILWIINMFLTIFLFTQILKVFDYLKKGDPKPTGQINKGYQQDEELKAHSIFHNQPINAYSSSPTGAQHVSPWYNYLTTDQIPRVQRPQTLYQAPLVRSRSATNLEESFLRRQTKAITPQPEMVKQREEVQKELKYRQSANYTQAPPTQPQQPYETRPQLRSAMRNSRYQ